MLATRPADVASLAGDHVALTAAIAQAEEQLVGLEISRTAVASALEATRARISAHLGPEGRNARAGQRYAQRGQVTAVATAMATRARQAGTRSSPSAPVSTLRTPASVMSSTGSPSTLRHAASISPRPRRHSAVPSAWT